VVWRQKTNYSAPADAHIVDEARQWHVDVTGIRDCGSCSSCSLHDSIAVERQGAPSIGVMTTRFASAAELMSRVLGMPGYKSGVIRHPISNASDEQLAAYARAIVEQMQQLLVKA
jgi:hypothetical protein